jgi:hypothetical protein
MVRDAANAYCQDKLQPRILEAFRHEQTDPAIFHQRRVQRDPAHGEPGSGEHLRGHA